MTNEEIKAYKGNPAGTIFGLMEHIRPKKCEVVNGGNRMTNKEAIEMFKAIMKAEIERIPSHCGVDRIDEILELNKCVIEALEKADKYRWHDLRESSYDLPRVVNGNGESEYVLVKTGCFEWCDMEMAYYSYAKRQWSIDNYVLAWRYIEPFKEEE